jgi:hypothetical protein
MKAVAVAVAQHSTWCCQTINKAPKTAQHTAHHTPHSTQHTTHSTHHTAHHTAHSTQHTVHSTHHTTQHKTQHTAHHTAHSIKHSTQHSTQHSTHHTAHSAQTVNLKSCTIPYLCRFHGIWTCDWNQVRNAGGCVCMICRYRHGGGRAKEIESIANARTSTCCC